MTNQKLVSSLCYFSVFFFPLLLPFVIYLVTDEQEVKNHARRAFISHLIPVILLIAGIIIFSLSMFSFENRVTSILSGGFDFWSIRTVYFHINLFCIIFSRNRVECFSRCETVKISSRLPYTSCIYC